MFYVFNNCSNLSLSLMLHVSVNCLISKETVIYIMSYELKISGFKIASIHRKINHRLYDRVLDHSLKQLLSHLQKPKEDLEAKKLPNSIGFTTRISVFLHSNRNINGKHLTNNIQTLIFLFRELMSIKSDEDNKSTTQFTCIQSI